MAEGVEKLTRRSLAAWLAQRSGLSKRKAYKLLGQVLEGIGEALAAGAVVELRNFGVFEVFERKARRVEVPGRGQLQVPRRRSVSFRPGKALREALKTRRQRR